MLDEKIDEETVGIKLLSEGYMQAYIDFYYLTHPDCKTPSYIDPSPLFEKEFQLNKRTRHTLELNPANLTSLKNELVDGESFQREGEIKKCFKTYLSVAQQFEQLNDFETASYFHKRCLDVSNEFKYTEGQALAFKGLGICEEKVYNKFEAKENLETALEKAAEGNLDGIARDVSKDLVRVYQSIAVDHDQNNEPEAALDFFEKCLDMAHRVEDQAKEAECYQQIANIYENQGDMDKAIDYLNRFLEICLSKSNEQLKVSCFLE